MNPRTVLGGAGERYKEKFKKIFFPDETLFEEEDLVEEISSI